MAVALSGPLTPDHPAQPELLDLTNDFRVLLINELLVRNNLAAASREVQRALQS